MDGSRRYLKPSWFVGRIANPLLMRLGLVPTLAVRGRGSGRWHTVPVNVLELDGARYLVAPRGEADWVRSQFQALPDPSDHPVFRIDSA